MNLENWRGLAVIIATFCAIWSVQLTGNYFRIKRFLYAHVAATFSTELFISSGGDTASTAYFWLYVLTTLPILICAVLISARLLSHVPEALRGDYIFVPVALAIVAYFLTPWKPSPVGFFSVLQACILLVVGAQTRVAAEEVPNPRPHKTLGMLWVLQSILFFLYACGLNLSTVGWERIGNWLPALLVGGAMLKLAVDFQRSSYEPVTKLQA